MLSCGDLRRCILVETFPLLARCYVSGNIRLSTFIMIVNPILWLTEKRFRSVAIGDRTMGLLRRCRVCSNRTYAGRGVCRYQFCRLCPDAVREEDPVSTLCENGLLLTLLPPPQPQVTELCWVISLGMRTDRAVEDFLGTWGAELFSDGYWPPSLIDSVTRLHTSQHVLRDPSGQGGRPPGTYAKTQNMLLENDAVKCVDIITGLVEQIRVLPFVMVACRSGVHRSVALVELSVKVARHRCPWREIRKTHLELEWPKDYLLYGLDELDAALSSAQRLNLPPRSL